MTIKFLTQYGPYKPGNTVTLDAATEAALVADKVATTDLSGGVAYVAPVAKLDDLPVTMDRATGQLKAGGAPVSVAGNSSAVAASPQYIWAYNEDQSVVKRKTMAASRITRQGASWWIPAAGTPSNCTIADYAGTAFLLQDRTDANKPKLMTFTAGGFAYGEWTGLSLAWPTDRLLQGLVYVPDAGRAAVAGNVEIRLTDSGGGQLTIRYNSGFWRQGWNTLPIWDPSTAANYAFATKTSLLQIVTNTINFALNVVTIRVTFNNPGAASTVLLAPVFTWTKAKPWVAVTFDTSTTDVFTNFAPYWASKGLFAGIGAGGDDSFRNSTYTDGLATVYALGHDVYNRSWKRVPLTSATSADVLAREVGLQSNWMRAKGFTRGSELFSSIGNGGASEATCKAVFDKFGVELTKFGNTNSAVNYLGPAGMDAEHYIACVGWAGRTAAQTAIACAKYLGGGVMWFMHECPEYGSNPPPDSGSPGSGGGIYYEDAKWLADLLVAEQAAGTLEHMSPSKLAAALRCQA